MREYVREMVFEFYPNADGLLVESSDYGICHCPECGPRHYDHEYEFVRDLSAEVWKHNPKALILVYPHYFAGLTGIGPGPRTGIKGSVIGGGVPPHRKILFISRCSRQTEPVHQMSHANLRYT
jgi:hypothetical protein